MWVLALPSPAWPCSVLMTRWRPPAAVPDTVRPALFLGFPPLDANCAVTLQQRDTGYFSRKQEGHPPKLGKLLRSSNTPPKAWCLCSRGRTVIVVNRASYTNFFISGGECPNFTNLSNRIILMFCTCMDYPAADSQTDSTSGALACHHRFNWNWFIPLWMVFPYQTPHNTHYWLITDLTYHSPLRSAVNPAQAPVQEGRHE